MLRCSFLISLVLALAATVAYAQPPGGGFGRFGGMGGMRASSAMLLGIPEVQKEIGVTEDQKSKVEDLVGELREDGRSAMSGIDFQGLRDMSEEDRAKAMAEIRTKTEELSKKSDVKIAKVLDEKQVGRLKQLVLQRDGANAFTRADVVAKLGLNDDQKAKIKKIQDDARANRPTIDFQNATPEERTEFRTKMQEAQTKTLKDTLGVLNSDQAKTWSEMTGKEFKFPAFGGRGRGGNRPAAPTTSN